MFLRPICTESCTDTVLHLITSSDSQGCFFFYLNSPPAWSCGQFRNAGIREKKNSAASSQQPENKACIYIFFLKFSWIDTFHNVVSVVSQCLWFHRGWQHRFVLDLRTLESLFYKDKYFRSDFLQQTCLNLFCSVQNPVSWQLETFSKNQEKLKSVIQYCTWISDYQAKRNKRQKDIIVLRSSSAVSTIALQ